MTWTVLSVQTRPSLRAWFMRSLGKESGVPPDHSPAGCRLGYTGNTDSLRGPNAESIGGSTVIRYLVNWPFGDTGFLGAYGSPTFCVSLAVAIFGQQRESIQGGALADRRRKGG